MLKSNKSYRARQSVKDKDSSSTRPVYSYYNTGNKAPAEPDKAIDLSGAGRKLRMLPATLAVLVIVFSFIFSFTLSTSPSAETLGDQQSPYRDFGQYMQSAEEILSESLSNRTKITIQTSKVEEQLLQKFPELRSVSLRLPVLGRKPTLVLDVRQPALIISTNTQNFVLDNTGVVVSDVRSLGSDYKKGIPVVLDQSSSEMKLGQQVLTSETVQFVLDVKAQIEAKDMKISQFVLPVSINELDMSIEGLPYFVKTDTSGDARLQVGGFIATKNYLDMQGIVPSEYIDARVEEKVFYK